MDYDPIKDRLITLFEQSAAGQRLFFGILHSVFLRSWYVRRALRRTLPSAQGTRVLDAGAGFGQYTDWMLRRYPGVSVTAVDIKDDYLARLSGYLNKTGLAKRSDVRKADLVMLEETLPDSRSQFDLVLSVDVMEHIEEDRAVFGHFARVLKEGGTLIINTPSDQGGSAVTGDGDDSFIGEHVRDGYGAAEITEKLESAGFGVESIEYGYGPAGSLAWRLLIQGPMLMLARSMLLLPVVALYYVVAIPVGLLLNAADMSVSNPTGTGLTVVARRTPPSEAG